jgi:hypothetical protein
MIQRIQDQFLDLQIIPFINLLGHTEGMLYAEEGHQFAEARFQGLQACPSNPDFFELCHKLVDDTLSIFPSDIIHLGGDETWQLGQCDLCSARVRKYEETPGVDGKAILYGQHFGVLAKKVADAGRRPAVWGDMFFDHPSAMDLIPKNTLIFDWQYFRGPELTSPIFETRGFETVYCPALHNYNATWLHLPQSEENVREHVVQAEKRNAYGVCVTTWELGLFGNYETVLPAIRAAGRMLQDSQQLLVNVDQHQHSAPLPEASTLTNDVIKQFLEGQAERLELVAEGGALSVYWSTKGFRREVASLREEHGQEVLRELASATQDGLISGRYRGANFAIESSGSELKIVPFPNGVLYRELRDAPYFLKSYLEESERHEEWARLMGIELQEAGGLFQFGGIRSALKSRLLLYSNPFLLWLRNREELCGAPGDRALQVFDRAISMAPNASTRGVAEFGRSAVEFVRHAEKAHQAYADNRPGEAIASITPCRQIFENLERTAKATHVNIGGSMADVERCKAGREHVDRVIRRIRDYGDRSLGYLPSFEMITHPKFMPHDQAAWWLINRWANE